MYSNRINIGYVCTSFLLVFTLRAFAQCPDGYVLKDSNLVVNGDFSLGNYGFNTDYRYVRKFHWLNPQVDPWGTYTVVHSGRYLKDNWANCFSPEGEHNPMFAADGHYKEVNIWQQHIKVKPATVYFFEAYFSTISSWDGVLAELGFYANEQELDILSSKDTCDWRYFGHYWKSGKNEKVNLEIKNTETERSGNDFVLDDIRLRECVKKESVGAKPNKAIVKDKIDHDEDNFAWLNPQRQIRVQGIQFLPNKTNLRKTSFPSLEAVLAFLQTKGHELQVEIMVHLGTPEKVKLQSRMLSQFRADVLKKYLVDHGLAQERIIAKGMGYQKPLRKDMRQESIQLNERVMLRFFAKDEDILLEK